MKPVEARLRELLPDERIRVLENTRFNPGETSNDPGSPASSRTSCDLFVNDAFGSAHRAHASTVGVAEHPARLRRPAPRARAGTARQAPRRRGASVRAHLRRGEGRGQARRAAEPRRPRGRGADRRQDGRGATRREPARVRRAASDRCRRRLRVQRGRRDEGRALRRAPGGLARARHRPRDARGLRAADRGRRRPSSGTGRWASSSGRASPRGRRPLRRPSPRWTDIRSSEEPIRSER